MLSLGKLAKWRIVEEKVNQAVLISVDKHYLRAWENAVLWSKLSKSKFYNNNKIKKR